jgi:hypothetical protein
MTDSEDRAIGRLEGKMDLMLAEQKAAAESRKQTYEKLETLDKKSDATNAKVAQVEARLAAVEEPVAEFSKWRERAIGAVMLVSVASALVGGGIVAGWTKIVAWFTN